MRAVPAKLGRYEIVKHLANGGMAQVLIARATGIEGFERHVVVKRINADHAADPAFVQMFLDEARTAAALHHNNIVQVHDIGKENDEYFFAMEYVHGQDLRVLLREHSRRKEKMPWEHVVTIMTAAASGLHHAHELRGPDRKLLGLVHRDVSPANILVGYDGTVKVVDFGIAKAALRTGEGTRGGALKGKVSYMAPEQCAGKQIDRRSDVYALGVVLYELCTVRRLFKGDNDFLTMSAIVAGDIPHPSKARPDIPPQLSEIILKALSKRPADRYQTADDMRLALEAFADEQRLRTSTSGLASYMKQLFGTQPEPWLDDQPNELELTVDFDGSASGLAQAADDAIENFALPAAIDPAIASAPIMKARRRITEAPPLVSVTTAEGSQGISTAKGTGTSAEALPLLARTSTKTTTGTDKKPLTIQIPSKTATPPAGIHAADPAIAIARTKTPPPMPQGAPPIAIARTKTPPAIPAVDAAAKPPADPGAVARKKSSSLPPPVQRQTPPSMAAVPATAERTSAPVLSPLPAVPAKPATPAKGVPTIAKPATPPSGLPSIAKPATPPSGVPSIAKPASGVPSIAKPATPPSGVPVIAKPAAVATADAPTATGPKAIAEAAATTPAAGPPERPSETPVSPLKLDPPSKPVDKVVVDTLPAATEDDFTEEKSSSIKTEEAAAVVAKVAAASAADSAPPAKAVDVVEAVDAVESPAAKPNRTLFAIIAVALVAVVAVIVIAKTGGGADDKKAPDPKPGPVEPARGSAPPPVAIDAPEKVETGSADPGSAASGSAAAGSAAGSNAGSNTGSATGSDAGSATAGSAGSGTGSGSAKKYRPPPKKKWNPDELFIK